jgi:hypothetical protein
VSVPGKLRTITSHVSTVIKNIQQTTEGVWYINKSNKKMYPRLRERRRETRPIQTGVTYAQVAQGQRDTPQPNVAPQHPTNVPQPANDLTELRQMMTNLLDQMGTLINLTSALVNKTN